MWKCPNCETLNNDMESCAVCGERRPINNRITPPPRRQVRHVPPRRVVPVEEPVKEKSKSEYTVIAILVSVLVLLLAVVVVVFALNKPNKNNDESNKVVYVTQEPEHTHVTETQRPTHQPVRTIAPTYTPTPTVSPYSAQAKAEKRTDYYTQAAAIETYQETVAKTATTQSRMNYESGIVYDKWDTLLNDVYKYLKQILPSSEFAALEKDELEWIIEKEAAVDKVEEEYKGGTICPLMMNSTASDYTQDRVYYLIGMIK